MNKAKSMRLTKPTIFVAMLIALALVCGMLATSKNVTANAYTLTFPGSGTNWTGINSSNFTVGNWPQKSAIAETLDATDISSTISAFGLPASNSTTNQDDQFSVMKADASSNLANSRLFYGHNSWNRQGNALTSGATYYLGVFYSMYASDNLVTTLKNGGNIKVTATATATNFSGTLNAYAYVGLTNSPTYNITNYEQATNCGGVGAVTTITTSDTLQATVDTQSVVTAISNITGGSDTATGITIGLLIDFTPNSTAAVAIESMDFAIDVPNPMSLPTGNHTASNDIGIFEGRVAQRVSQTSVNEIGLTKGTAITGDYTCIDNAAWNSLDDNTNGFSSNGSTWSYTNVPASTMIHLGFMHTFSISSEMYEQISAGILTISLSVSGTLSQNNNDNAYDNRLYMYVGLGSASEDDVAKTFSGYNEKAYDIDITNDGADEGYLSAANNQADQSKDFSNVSLALNDNLVSDNKYLRVACFFEIWSNKEQTISMSDIAFNIVIAEPEIAGNEMSTPGTVFDTNSPYVSDATAGWHSLKDTMNENGVQTNISTINGTVSGASYSDFTRVSDRNTDNKFTSTNTWSYNYASGVENYAFIHTVKITEDVYEKIINGTYKVKLTVSSGNFYSEGGALYNWLYLGLGNALSDSLALTYRGFKETSAVIGNNNTANKTHLKYSNKTNVTIPSSAYVLLSNDPIASNLKTGATQTLNEAYCSGNKYLRMALFTEFTSTSSGTKSTSGIEFSLSITEVGEITTTQTVLNMTQPEESTWTQQTFYDEDNYRSIYSDQVVLHTIGYSNGNVTTTGVNNSITTDDTTGTLTYSGWGSTKGDVTTTNPSNFTYFGNQTADASEGKTNSIRLYYDSGEEAVALGVFYTWKLSEQVYTALLNGKIKLNATLEGVRYNDFTIANCTGLQYAYVGLGTADSDESAMGGRSYRETIGYNYGSKNFLNNTQSTSTDVFSISDFSFADHITHANNTSCANSKYLRIGVWLRFFVTNKNESCGIQFGLKPFTMSLTPVKDSTAPTFSGITNGYANAPVTINDSTGIDRYKIVGSDGSTLEADIASLKSTSIYTSYPVLGTVNGVSYTLTAWDLWGNTSSQTFTYFKPVIKVVGHTDGVVDDYTGGKIGLSIGSNSGSGDTETYLYRNATYANTIYVHARAKAGYYFAGFTIADLFTSAYNLDLNTSYSYAEIDTTNYEYTFKFTISNLSTIPLDGVIDVKAYFKEIITEGEGTYDYDQNQRPITTTEPTNEPSVGTMRSETTYTKGSSSSTTAPKDAGTYTTVTKIYWNNNVVGTKDSGTITITPITTTATYTATSKVYDGGVGATGIITGSLSGILSGDVVNITGHSAVFLDKNVGENKTINVSNIALTGSQAGNYVLSATTATTTGAITPKDITVNYTLTKSKEYDGNTTATATFTSFTGLVSGDDVNCSLTATYNDKNAGSNKTITVVPSFSGIDVQNYKDITTYTHKDGIITKKALSITYDPAESKVYDNSNIAQVAFVDYVGMISGDSLTCDLTAVFSQKKVGENLTITVTAVFGGTDIGNYNPTTSYQTEGCSITPRPITFTAEDKTQVYGYEATELAYQVGGDRYATGESESNFDFEISRATGNDVGEYAITITATNTNYNITTEPATYTITARPITFTAKDTTQVYGNEATELAYQVSGDGYATGESASNFDLEISRATGNNVGEYAITIVATNTNYNITTEPATYTITARPLTVSFEVRNKVYDANNIATNQLTATLNGVVTGDDVDVTFNATYDNQNVGENKAISVKDITLTGEKATNYSISDSASATGNITPATLTIKLSYDAITYGDNAVLNVAYEGFKGTDDASAVIATAPAIVDGDEIFVVGNDHKLYSNSSNSKITPATINGANYNLVYEESALVVNKKQLTVTYLGVKVGENYVTAVDYTGSTFALEYSIEGFVNGENESVINKAPTTTIANADYPNVGTYDVSFVEGVDDNYSFEYVAGTLTINKIALTIKYRDESITFGNTPSGAFEYTGFVPGETASTALTTQASVTLPTDAILGVVTVGTYTLTPSGAEARNYTISYQSGTLTVGPKPITATFGKTITYGETLVATMDDITVSGLVTGDSKDSLTISAQDLSKYKKAGTHTISSSDITIVADNYTVTVSGSATINKAPLTITYLGESAEYSGTYHYPSQNKVEVVGFVASDSISLGDFVFNHDPMISVSQGYGINISLTAEQKEKLTNYDYTTVSGTYIIMPRPIIISAVANGKVYGSSDPALTHVVEHATDSTAEAIVGSNLNVLNISVAREVGENVGTYTIDVSYTPNSNYSVTTNTAEFTISPLAVNITFANDAEKVYNGKTDVAVSYVIVNKVGEDALTLTNLVANTADANVGENKVVTLSAFALDGEAKDNYTLDGATTNKDGLTITITKATLTVTIKHKQASITEGDVVTQDDFSITYEGFVNGETESVLVGTKVSVDCEKVKELVAGTRSIPYIPGEDANYSFDYAGVGTIVVVPARTQIDTTNLIFESETYIYNGENQFVVISWSDMPSYVSVAYSYTDALGNAVAEHKNVGSYKVTAYFTVSNPDYYMENESYTVDMVIGAKVVKVTFDSTGLSKIYDGNLDITLASSQPTVDGLLGEDSITYDLTAKFEDANVGVGKKITLNSTVATPVGATDLNNYNIILVGTDSLTADIIAKDVTVTFSSIGLSKGYDGNTNIALASQPTVDGLLGEDSITYDLTAKFDDANIGVGKEITLNSTVATPVGTTNLGNYNINLVGADSLTADITAREVDLTYTLNNTKTFDGTTALPEGNITNVAIVNAVDGETLSYTITGEYSSKNATLNDSTITLTITKSIGGATAGNYYFEDGGIDTVDGKINQKQVTVILEEQTSVYKEAVVVDQNKWHLKEGDSIIEDLGIRIIKAATSENAGTYPLTATKSNDNYHVTFISANYVISQAVTEVKFDLMKKEFEYTGEAVAINISNFYVYTNRDNITAGIVYPEFATDALGNPVEIKNVGTYTLTFKVVNDTTDLIPDNFQEAEASVTISVLKATPTFDFTEVDQTIYRYNGVEQHITGVTSTNTDGAVVSYSNNTFVDVPDGGVLTITVSVTETENYYPTTATHDVTILKADYDLSGYAFDNAEYDYNGTTRSIMAVGLPSSITVSYTYGETTQATPFAFKDAGIYIVKASYVIDVIGERNYNYPTSLIASASLKINQINITVEVTHQEGYYGEEPEFDPAGIKVIAGNFVDGDPIDLDLKLEPKDSYPIGVYQLVATTTSSGNYNVTVARGTYTILPRPVTFRADNQFSEYGDEDAELTYSLDPSSPYEPLENDVFTVALTREEGKIPGKYAITGTIVNPNYAVTLLTRPENDSHGTYTILPRKITIVLYNQEGTKASQISKKGYKVSGGILRGDDLDIKVVPVDEIGSTPGEYQLTASYNENPNYDVTVKGAIFTLRLATKISVSNLIYTKLYDGVPYVFDAKVSSGAEPVFTVNGIFVENSFTEVGIYEIAITAPIVGDYAEPEQFTFTFEIRPTELIVEQAGITFILSKESGFGADETLDVHQTQEIVLSGENYTQEIDSAYTIYIVKGDERIPLEEYAQGEKVSLKIKLSDELQNLGVSTWFMDSEENVLHAVDDPSEDGFVEVALEGGSMHILFVAERGEAMPLLIIGCAMGLAFVILFFFYLFRKKAL